MTRRNLDLEVLRAFAIIFTIFAHVQAWMLPGPIYPIIHSYTNFACGVDLFFCISGFIITRNIYDLRPRTKNTRDFFAFAVPFWVKRFFRLAPSAWLWVGITLVLAWFFQGDGAYLSFDRNLAEGISAIFQYNNIRSAICRPAGNCGNMAIYWSLSLEEQFYLLFPIVIVIFSRKRALSAVLLCVVASQFFLKRTINDVPWFFRPDAICYGVLLGVWANQSAIEQRTAQFLSETRMRPLAVAILFAALARLSNWSIPLTSSLVALVALLIVWLASFDRDLIMRPSRIKNLLVGIGARSYVIYLTHVPAIFVTRTIYTAAHRFNATPTESGKFLYLATSVVLTAIFTEATRRLVETPLRRYGASLSKAVASRLAGFQPQVPAVMTRR